MKPDREAYLRRVSAPSGPWVQLTGAMLREVFDEVDALRRLPVIAMCNHCAWCVAVEDDDDWCEHPGADDGDDRAVDATRPPPSWCPMRGAQ